MTTILDQLPQKNYYINIRNFANGTYEAVMKAVRPLNADVMEARADGAAYSQHCREKGASAMDGFPKRFKINKETGEASEYEKESNHERAVRRAKQQIRWLCKTMDADRLFTLTYRANVEDREQVRKDFARFLRLVRSGWAGQQGIADWRYVAVLERQDRGAYHVHCAVKGWQKVTFLRAAWYRALGGTGKETGLETPGQVDVTSPKKRFGGRTREWKAEKLAGYLTKYLQKTFDQSTFEKRRYWHSKDLEVPEKKQLWIGGTNIVEAIVSTIQTLQNESRIKDSFDMWLSSDYCTFWIAGGIKDGD